MSTPVPEYADGGIVFHNPEAGSDTPDDSVPVQLQPGEYIVPAGTPVLRADALDDEVDEDVADVEESDPAERTPKGWESVENGEGGWTTRPYF